MLAAWPRAGHLTSLSLSFLTCTWSCDGASCTVFACLEPWLAAVSSQDCRLPAGVLRACDKVTPQALPQAGWAQGTASRGCRTPLPSPCRPLLQYCFLATRCWEGAPSPLRVFLPGEAAPRCESVLRSCTFTTTQQNRNFSTSGGIWGVSCEESPQESRPQSPPAPDTHTQALPALPPQVAGCGVASSGQATVCAARGQAAVKHQEPGCGPHPHPLLSLEWRPAGGQKPFRKLENCFQTLTIKIETTCFVLRGEGAQGCAWWSEAA